MGFDMTDQRVAKQKIPEQKTNKFDKKKKNVTFFYAYTSPTLGIEKVHRKMREEKEKEPEASGSFRNPLKSFAICNKSADFSSGSCSSSGEKS